MSNTYKTKEDVLRRAQEAVGKTFGEIDKTGRLSTGKGAAGNVIEESWFGSVSYTHLTLPTIA